MKRLQKVFVAMVSLAMIGLVGAPATANAASPSSTPAAAHEFPSAASTVIASVGFIDETSIGYFWSAARGDSVEQTIVGKKKITKAILLLDVTVNGLAPGAETDWDVIINETTVGSFTISSGQMSPVKTKIYFPAMTGRTYDVKIAMTNEVAPGEGAIALRYAGDGPHQIRLNNRP